MPERDESDWEGVEFHTHEDGTRHVTVKLSAIKRRPWWREPALWHWFRNEIVLISVYTIWSAVGVVMGWTNVWNLLTATAMLILLASIIIRAISSYRIGFTMGTLAVPLAMTQPSPKRAAELLERSSELWDPPPAAVAHTMEIERLEREVNKGHSDG